MLDDHFCGAYFQPADPESLHHLIPKWSQIFVPPPHSLKRQHLRHTLVMQQLEPWPTSQPLLGWFGALFFGLDQTKAVEGLCMSVPPSAADQQPSVSPRRRFSSIALCCADLNSWQPLLSPHPHPIPPHPHPHSYAAVISPSLSE